ncbi:hypothetical protein STENM223S_01257 [Streptomyces tendae]
MCSVRVTSAASSAGTSSRTTAKGARVLHRLGVAQQLLGRLLAAALHPVAHGVDGLRGEADVGHHGDAGLDEQPDLLADRSPPSSLTAPTPASLTSRVAERSACTGPSW